MDARANRPLTEVRDRPEQPDPIGRHPPLRSTRPPWIGMVAIAVVLLTVSVALDAPPHEPRTSASIGPASEDIRSGTSLGTGFVDPISNLSIGAGVPVSWSVAGSSAEAQEAVDPVTHDLYATWMSSGWIWFARSNDSGSSFSRAQIVAGSQSFSNATVFAQSWDPAIATSVNGTVYVAFINANTSVNNLGSPVIAVSYDHGRTFAFSTQVYVPRPTGASDRPFVAVGPNGSVYLTWDDAPRLGLVQFLCSGNDSCSFAAGDLNTVFSRSLDGGHTWSRIVSLSPNFPDGGAWTAPILVEPTGRIDVLYGAYHTASGVPTLSHGREFFTTSNDSGSTWSRPVLVGNRSEEHTSELQSL
jgi:hypothetical protein